MPCGNETQLRHRLEEDLVLGKYPISFVKEVYRTTPGDFLGSYLKLNSLEVGDKNGTDVSNAHGSMLPSSTSSEIFSSGGGFRTESSRFFSEAHSTVHTWEVRASGHVHIRDACVVSSSVGGLGQCSTQDSRIIAATTMPPMSSKEHGASLPSAFQSLYGDEAINYGNPSWFNLNLWISRQPNCTHAILTEFRHGNEERSDDYALECSGIIIQEGPPGTLKKTAHFRFYDVESVLDLSEVEKVDWLVA